MGKKETLAQKISLLVISARFLFKGIITLVINKKLPDPATYSQADGEETEKKRVHLDDQSMQDYKGHAFRQYRRPEKN
jgi:hypothetical protein